jgi:hypothetical protein
VVRRCWGVADVDHVAADQSPVAMPLCRSFLGSGWSGDRLVGCCSLVCVMYLSAQLITSII